MQRQRGVEGQRFAGWEPGGAMARDKGGEAAGVRP